MRRNGAGWRRNKPSPAPQPPAGGEPLRLMGRELRLAQGRAGPVYDARMDLRIGGAPVVLETEAALIERLTRFAAPWSAFAGARAEEAAMLFERLCASDVTALERKLGATVMIEELRIGEPCAAPPWDDRSLRLSVDLDGGDYAVRLDAASAALRERLGALLAPITADANPQDETIEAVVALGPFDDVAQALAAAAVGDVMVVFAAGEALRAVVQTPARQAPARLGVDVLALRRAFAPRRAGDDPSGYVEIGRLGDDLPVMPGVEVEFRHYDADRARYWVAGRVRAVGRLVTQGGDLAFVIDELPLARDGQGAA